jgi:prophage regulatory protein
MTTQNEFPRTGYVRLNQVLAPNGPIPVSKSTWWKGVRDGRFPQPRKLGPGTTVWLAEEIRALYEHPKQAQPASLIA